MGIYKYYKEGSPAVKVMIIGGAIVGLGIAYFGVVNPLRKLIIKTLDQSKEAKEGKEAKDQLSDLAKDGIKPTISDAQAESFSNSLVSAFGGCGTDEGAIYLIMQQLNNDADVYLLMSKYGIRKYDACNWEFDFGDNNKSLSGAVSDELDSAEKENVNNILRTKGIKFQFT